MHLFNRRSADRRSLASLTIAGVAILFSQAPSAAEEPEKAASTRSGVDNAQVAAVATPHDRRLTDRIEELADRHGLTPQPGVDPTRRGLSTGALFLPRIAGLSIVINSNQPVPAGRDVNFDVDLTTSRIGFVNSSRVLNSTIVTTSSGAGLAGVFNGTVVTNSNEALDLPRLGTAQRSRTLQITRTRALASTVAYEVVPPRGLSGSTTAPFTGQRLIVDGATTATFNLGIQSSGAAPAIDFGDGATVPTTAMTGIVSQTTEPLDSASFTFLLARTTTRYRRAGLSHTYPPTGVFNLAVNSGCCASQAGTPTAVGPTSLVISTASLNQRGSSRTEIDLAGNFQFNSQSVLAFNTSASTPYTSMTTDTDSTSQTTTLVGYPFQRLQATEVIGSVLEIPVLSSSLLAALALLLGGCGLLLLRR